MFKVIEERLLKLFEKKKKSTVKETVKKQRKLVAVKSTQVRIENLYWVATTTGVYCCKGCKLLGKRGGASPTTTQSLYKGFVFATESEAREMYDRLMGCRDV